MSEYLIHKVSPCERCQGEGKLNGGVIRRICPEDECMDGWVYEDIPLEETQIVKDLKARVHNLENEI